VNNHFALVILAAERARQLANGAAPQVACSNKSAVTALREISGGHVSFNEDVDETVRTFVAERKRLDGETRIATKRKRLGASDG
jgi:DNA-directed RNA polymerase subunit omega